MLLHSGTIGDETKISRREPGPLSPLPSHLFFVFDHGSPAGIWILFLGGATV